MEFGELLANPVVQGALAPFLVALIVAAVLRNTRIAGLAIALAILATVTITIGWSFESMGSTRKLSILLLGAAALVLVGGLATEERAPLWELLLAMGVGLGSLWVAWNVIRQMEANGAVAGATVVLYGMALALSLAVAGLNAVRACAAALMLGLAAGGVEIGRAHV